MTNDELIKHRLHELEQFATGARQIERDVDTLKITTGAMEKTLTEIKTEVRSLSSSVGGLYKRLDEALREQAREEGREEGRVLARAEVEAAAVEKGRQLGLAEARKTNWRVIAFSVGATTSFGLLIVAALNFALN